MRRCPANGTWTFASASISVISSPFEDLGENQVKNIARPVPVLRVLLDRVDGDVLTQLAQVSRLKVASRRATTKYRNREVNNIGRADSELGVRYVLEGSVRTASDQIRVTAQLVEVATGDHVWAEHHDLSAPDALKALDDIVERVTTELVVQMRSRDLQLAKATPPQLLDAYGFYLLGKDALGHCNLRGIEVARKMFDKATAADASCVPAVAGKALIELREFKIGRSGLQGDRLFRSGAEGADHGSRGRRRPECRGQRLPLPARI